MQIIGVLMLVSGEFDPENLTIGGGLAVIFYYLISVFLITFPIIYGG